MEKIFHSSDLLQRKEPKKKQEYIVKILEKKVVEEKKDEKEEDIEIGETQKDKTEIIMEEKVVVYKDKRKTSSNLIDRELILKKLKIFHPVQKTSVSKSPEVLEKKVEEEKEEKEEKANQKEVKQNTIFEEEPEKETEPKDLETFQEVEREVNNEMELENLEEIEQEEKEKQPKNQTEKRKRTKKTKEPESQLPIEPFDFNTAKIGNEFIKDKLPVKKQKLRMAVSAYYMNNRKLFITQLAKLFKPYQDKLAEKAGEISCKTARNESIDFELLTHQLVVRDYLNLYTPYRGLLLYHGLGSGKTCTSIGIAEGMKTDKEIVLMTPASLKMNFFSELKKCGDVLYKKNSNWEFVSIAGEPQNVRILSNALSIPQEYIKEHGGAWLMDVKKPPNYSELSDNDQKNLDDQLNVMIRNKYQDINYNGLTKKKINELTKNGKINLFDHKVVIIDEAHNLVSRISNSLKKKDSIAYRLYKDLMDATDTKIIFLTGTPIINTPREIGILFNMLRGFIKTWTFQIQTTTTKKINRDILLDYFKDARLLTYDYVDYSGDKLTITRNPFGFINMYRKTTTKKGGDKKDDKKQKNANKPTKKIKPVKTRGTKKITQKKHADEIYDDDANDDVFDKEIEKTDEEKEEEMYNRLDKEIYEGGSFFNGLNGGGIFEEYAGVRYDETGNISDADFQKQITQILNKNEINIVGKPKLTKELCLPDDENVFKELFINNEKGELINIDLLKRRILGLTSYFRSAQEQLLPRFVKNESGGNYHTVNIEMSQHQFDVYQEKRKEERDEERQRRKNKKKGGEDEEDKLASTYRIYSRSACNFAFPPEHPRPSVRNSSGEVDINEFNGLTKDMIRNTDDYFEDEEAADVQAEGETDIVPKKNIAEFQNKIKETYEFLEYRSSNPRPKEYLTEKELARYSPKFLNILEKIKDVENKGLHLLYSQFRTLEGIGIFKLVLEANGFAEFKITKKSGEWEIIDAAVDPEKPRFVLYTGTETAEEKEIIRNIYNSAWELVPPSIVEVLKQQHSNNYFGEVVKVMMITSSGAEGINLRNTRFVHIMEPYWNMVRIDQVVGRARRICSHEDLPEELRTVQVFIYLSTMTEDQLSKNIEMRIHDLSKLTYPVKEEDGAVKQKRIPFSTDQYLFEIAQIKDSINRQILTAVKESAVDCSLYNTNPEEPLVCYGFGKVASNNFGSYPTLEMDRSEKTDVNVRTEKVVLIGITVDGVKYAMDKKTYIVYDFESYKLKKEKKGELVPVGTLDPRTQKIVFDK